MFDRKTELKKWFLDNPAVTPATLAKAYSKSPASAYSYLYHHPTAPKGFIKVCKLHGIPDNLLPDPTLTKFELQARVEELEAENTMLREQVAATA